MDIKKKLEDMEAAHWTMVRANEMNHIMMRPVMSDYGLLEDIYAMSEKCHYKNRVFIFVALLLYEPSRLFGGKMKYGVRRRLSRITGCMPSTVSIICRELLFYFHTYPGYRREVEECYNEAVKAFASR